MTNLEKISQLLASLGMEINTAQAGSNAGQFPILDLIGNLRDEAEKVLELVELHKQAAPAWERMVTIVESGKPFNVEELLWLNELFGKFESLVKSGGASVPMQSAPQTTAPAAPVSTAPDSTPAANGGETTINLNVAADGDLLREFIIESREHLDNIERGVLVLENQPDDAETLNTVFRAFHTFKGGAGFLNLIPINRLAHVLESLLDLARQGKLTIDANVIDVILRGRDVLKQFLDEIESQIAGQKAVVPILIPTEALKAEVQQWIDGVNSGTLPTPATRTETPAQTASSDTEPVRADAAKPNQPGATETNKTEHSATVKVDTGKLDGLLDLVGEMVIAQSLVGQDMGQIAHMNPQLGRNMAQLGRITKELQRVSMSLRMVPIRGVFQKMARVARDVGIKQSKKVNFQTAGDDTELDRGVVEELNDPLLHMIRNSMDHGIEAAEKRIAAGKPAMGAVNLRAYHQGGNIVVEIEDDGAGLDKDRILKKAIERGLTTPDRQHSEQEIFAFIFAAGFSTAEKITDLSGRGVGLDVVRRNIEKLRGRVDISSTRGKGTLFKITLPLTLAIIDGLIVKVGEERYIIPTLSVCESFRPQPEMISRLQGKAEVVNVRGRLIPLLRLHELFGIKTESTDPAQGIVVVAQSGTDTRCLLVDGLLHKQEVVIKNLNDMMVHKNRALAGAAILGDGRVGLILDVNALVHLEVEPISKAA